MKKLFQRILAVVLSLAILMPYCTVSGAAAADSKITAENVAESVTETPVLRDLNEKSKELAKQLAEKGIKKAIGKIPVIGDTVNSLAGPYIKDLLGIKEGESTGEKLDKINTKLDELMSAINAYGEATLQRIYESDFKEFNDRLTRVKGHTAEYLRYIEIYEESGKTLTDEQKNGLEEAEIQELLDAKMTVLVAGLTEIDYFGFSNYLDDLTYLANYVTGNAIQLHQQGDIYTKAFRIFCADAKEADGCALGGEAAMIASDYVNSVNEIVDTGITTAAMILIARCSIGNDLNRYKQLQRDGIVTGDVNLNSFSEIDATFKKGKYDDLKKAYYDIFGITEEDVACEEAVNHITLQVSPGVVGQYNQMIEDRWFDYIVNVSFNQTVPEVEFIEMDGEIGYSVLTKYGFDERKVMSLSEDSSVSLCKDISKKALTDKRAALNDEQFNQLLKHIEKSKYFKYEKSFEGADDKDISLHDALVLFGFSFAGLDSSGYGSSVYSKVFMTNAKCEEDYYNSYEPSTHEGYIDGYVYGIDYNTLTREMNQKSAVKTYQYFEGTFSDHSADKRNISFPQFTMLYFTQTIEIDSTSEFKNFITSVKDGKNYAGKTVYLNTDVDLRETNYLLLWPDSARSKEFCGTFEGNGHKIKNLTISGGEHRQALFRTTGEGAIIRNLTFDNVNISNTAGKCGYAALVGYANGSLRIDNVTIANGSITGYQYVGGLVGETKEGKNVTVTLNKCINNVNITSEDTDAGGFIGNAAALDIFSCENNGTITAKKGAAGGIVGYVGTKDTDPIADIENCTNNGTIIGYDCAGGICGHIQSDNESTFIVENTNRGNVTVTAKRSAGGIVGRTCTGGIMSDNINYGNIENLSTNDDADAGGILGQNEDDAITMYNNENKGNVTAGNRAGGIVGTLGDKDHDKKCDLGYNVNSGRIVSNNKDAGGIVGAVATDSTSHTIKFNTNSGTIEAKNNAGGIVGWMAGGGLFEGNTSKAKITSTSYDAGGIVGRIEDDSCNFKNSDVGNPLAASGTVSPRAYSERDYLINAKSDKQHAGIICGWDGKRGKTINSDNLTGSIFGTGSLTVIIIMSILLILAIGLAVYFARKSTAGKPKKDSEERDPEKDDETAEPDAETGETADAEAETNADGTIE